MPRKRQGGPVQGTPGTSYKNRTDLAKQPSLPARVVAGQTYGTAQSQLQAQHQVPMAPAPLPLPSAPTSGPSPGQGAPGLNPLSPGAPPGPPPANPITPGMFGDLHRATERPNEPVTTGTPNSPGAGPEVLPPAPITGQSQVSELLAQAGQKLGSSFLSNLASRAQAAGQ